jgi:hypothetical protein
MAESSASRLEHPVTVLIAEDEDLLRASLPERCGRKAIAPSRPVTAA